MLTTTLAATRKKDLRGFKLETDNPDVLAEPAPQVFFLEFGDSTLNFELRVFVKNLEMYLPVKHALHLGIDNAFRAAGVDIAFRQQDIHVRSIKSVLDIDNHKTMLQRTCQRLKTFPGKTERTERQNSSSFWFIFFFFFFSGLYSKV